PAADWPEILANPAGMNPLYRDVFARIPLGTYDVLTIQSDTATWTTETSSGCGQLIDSPTEAPFILAVGIFPAGLLSQPEKDALAVPAPVFFATTETSAATYAISAFEELFCYTDGGEITV